VFGALAVCILGSTLSAQTADPMADRMLAAYRAWLAKHNFQKSSVAIIRDGRLIADASHGATNAATPEPVASVSKSITGICIVKLVEMGRLRYNATIGSLLSGFIARHGGTSDPRMPAITVEQLLTHTSGIGDNSIDAKKVRLMDQMSDTIRLRLASEPGKTHHYENTNFQILGAIIETVMREPYEQVCHRLVLLPAGAKSAHISRVQPYMSSWAGWVISAREYALFMRSFDPKFGLLRTGPRDWPKTDLGNGWFYSVGVQLRHNSDDTYSVLHTGLWSWDTKDQKHHFMARFVYWGSGIGFAMNASPPIDGLGQDLENQMWLASLPKPGDLPAEPIERVRQPLPEAGPSDVVNMLYKVQAAAQEHGPMPTDKSQRRQFFDDKLLALLETDDKIVDREGMGRLSFDPFYAGQDFKITKLKVGQATITGETARLHVNFNNFGTPQELTYRLVRQAGGWRISNISLEKGDLTWDLVSVLEGKD